MKKLSTLVITICWLASGCGGKQATTQESAPPPKAPPPEEERIGIGTGTGTGICPVLKAGAQLEVEETADAVALQVFIDDDQRDWARDYLRKMAARHEDRRTEGGKPRHRENLAPHSTSIENTPEGARVLYRPLNPADLDALRMGVHEHAKRLPGVCGTE